MTTVKIQGMKCQHCVGTTKKVIEELGATNVTIDLAKGEAHFEGTLDGEALRQAITAKGFTVVE